MTVSASRLEHGVPYVLFGIRPWSRKSHKLVSPVPVCIVTVFSGLCFGVQKNRSMDCGVVGGPFP